LCRALRFWATTVRPSSGFFAKMNLASPIGD
jgi:hypothetical protein